MFWCSCGSPSAPPSWLYEGEVNPDGYWITGFSVHMQAPLATQLCDSGGLSVSWKVFTGSCWCGADIYSGGRQLKPSGTFGLFWATRRGLGHTGPTVPTLQPPPPVSIHPHQRVLPHCVCSANFGRYFRQSALWSCFRVPTLIPSNMLHSCVACDSLGAMRRGATVGVSQWIKNKVYGTASHLSQASPSGQSDDISCMKKTKTTF